MRHLVRRVLASLGYRLEKIQAPSYEPAFLTLHEEVKPYTMTSIERQYALYLATNYVIDAHIPGAIVECGVWKGGSAMLAARTLLERGVSDRAFYLYDTFTGMSEPTQKDVNLHGNAAKSRWEALKREDHNDWDYASKEEVQKHLDSTGYPKERITLIAGKVEETIPKTLPESIAILRLDTDWYESTKHELEHLFPRIEKGGVLIIDDYGHWKGAREAVDEYVKKYDLKLLLQRVDYTGRMALV